MVQNLRQLISQPLCSDTKNKNTFLKYANWVGHHIFIWLGNVSYTFSLFITASSIVNGGMSYLCLCTLRKNQCLFFKIAIYNCIMLNNLQK